MPQPSTTTIMPSQSSANVGLDGAENTPLIRRRESKPRKKPFYRPRPLWLVPFAVVASSTRGMTLAPRVQNFFWRSVPIQSNIELYASLDPMGPSLHPLVLSQHLSAPLRPLPFPRIMVESVSAGTLNEDPEDPRNLPSVHCVSDPAVQAGAARLQTIVTTTVGIFSALTTGWWGHFGERHGRIAVLAIASLGLFLTDIIFILASTPSSPLSHYGHIFLLVSPFIEGLLGGWTTLQSTTMAYLSDCTSSGSRAYIFSRFAGVFYIGTVFGPSISGWLIQHPISNGSTVNSKSVTTVFWVAITCSFINMLLVLFVFPESLSKEKRVAAMAAYQKCEDGKRKALAENPARSGANLNGEEANEEIQGVIKKFLAPLALFLPVVMMDPAGSGQKRRDWSLTLLAVTLFGCMLSSGVNQIKYLYAEHVYGWDAGQLSYYISFMGGTRAIFLLFVLPSIIQAAKKKKESADVGTSVAIQQNDDAKRKLSIANLGREITFDLILTRCSLVLEVLANTCVVLSPAPSYKDTTLSDDLTSSLAEGPLKPQHITVRQSEALFVLTTAMMSLGGGILPAVQSLALCILQVRSMGEVPETGMPAAKVASGALFGAFAVLQAVGQMIIGPMLFGLMYSETVAKFPKGIFVMSAGLLICSLTAVYVVRNPVRPTLPSLALVVPSKNGQKRRKHLERRGRSRKSKDLREEVVGYFPAQYGSADVEATLA